MFSFCFAQEVKSLLEELSFQKGELNVQISEKKTQLTLIRQEIEKEEENLQVVLGQMSKHKTGKFKGKQFYFIKSGVRCVYIPGHKKIQWLSRLLLNFNITFSGIHTIEYIE